MELIVAAFLLVAVAGDQQGPISINQLGAFPDRATCQASAAAVTAQIKATGTLMVDIIGCISADDLKTLGDKSFGGQ